MKNFVGIGGGEIIGWNFKTKDSNQLLYETKEIDEYIVSLSQKKNPKLLFIGTASKENPIYFNAFKNIYEKVGCDVEELKLFDETENEMPLIKTRIDEIRQKILSVNVIYIGGGNTKRMLNKWSEFGIGQMLVEAYENGIIVSGFSAGCYSFFKYNYELIEGLGIINAIICVHYNEKSEEKKNQFLNTIKEKNLPGITLDNGTAIHYFDNKFKIIKSIKEARAYKIICENGDFVKEELNENIKYEL